VHARARELIARFGLEPHPEGGWYRETVRTAGPVRLPGFGGPRDAGSAILFLLDGACGSRWHRLRADELWHFHEGDPVELFTLAPGGVAVERRLLGLAADAAPQRLVPGGSWQAARVRGGYALVGCTVTPGFDFADFALLRETPAEAALLRPVLGELVALL
jgi:hypothetical protein